MIKVKATEHHLLQLSKAPGIKGLEKVNESNAKNIEDFPYSYAIIDDCEHVWAIMGVLQVEEGEWEAWIMIDPRAGKKLLSIARVGREILNQFPYQEKMITLVEAHYEKVQRFDTKILGFKLKERNIKRNGRVYDLFIRGRNE